MAHRVEWSGRAIADLESIAAYIAADSPNYAKAVVKRVVALAANLAKFPHAGRQVPEFDDVNIREVFAYSYRMIYQVGVADVTIAAVIHGKRALS